MSDAYSKFSCLLQHKVIEKYFCCISILKSVAERLLERWFIPGNELLIDSVNFCPAYPSIIARKGSSIFWVISMYPGCRSFTSLSVISQLSLFAVFLIISDLKKGGILFGFKFFNTK